jgi:hypothetical protein
MSTTATPPTPQSAGQKIKTFFDHIGEWFSSLGKSGNWMHKAALVIAVIRPLLTELVGLAAGTTAEAKVSATAAQVETDLNNAEAILTGAETTGTITLSGLLSSLQTNMSSLVSDAGVKNSTKSTEIISAAQTILGEIQAIAQAVPSDFQETPTGSAA